MLAEFECVFFTTIDMDEDIIEEYKSLIQANGMDFLLLNNKFALSSWRRTLEESQENPKIKILISDVPFTDFPLILPFISEEAKVFYVSERVEDFSVYPLAIQQVSSHKETLTHLKENLSNYLLGWEEDSSKSERTQDEAESQTEECNESPEVENLEVQDDSTDVNSGQEAEGEVKEQEKSETTALDGIEEQSTDNEGESTLTDEQHVNYQENPYQKRARKLQKQVFAKHRWDDHHTIGIWSPIPRMGVTSLTMNFGFYLAKRSVYTAVLEGLTERHALKDWLKRYTNMPTDWKSLAYAIQNDSAIEHTNWNYKNVTFLPLDRNDPHAEWNHDSLESYITTTRVMDVTLVDLPTGKMESYTKDSLQFLDQLWIVVDDAFQETVAWKDYIKELEDAAGIPIYLVFNKTYEFSQTERMQKALGYPLLTTLPALHEETMRSYYESTPLYFHAELQPLLDEGFDELAHHLFKEPLPSKVTEEKQKLGWVKKILKPLLT